MVVTLTNTEAGDQTLSTKLTGDPAFVIASGVSCGATLYNNGSCVIAVDYTPSQSGTQTATLTLAVTSAASGTAQQTVVLTGTGAALSPGESIVSATDNPLVALYTIDPPIPGKVSVDFGQDTNYGRSTWAVQSPASGGPVSIFVAGMQADTAYHMRATTVTSDGTVLHDSDRTFTTSHFAANLIPEITANATGTPQPGVELLNSTPQNSKLLQAIATDLSGNLIWAYDFADRQSESIINPIKLLSNGDFLMSIGDPSQNLVDDGPPAAGTPDTLREINPAGDPVRELTMVQLNAELAAAGYNLTLGYYHHDFALLPNGHIVVLANTLKSVTGLTGYSGAVNVAGDVLVDLDENFRPVWVWNEFDYLDVNRHPMSFPDWTHTNAVLYSPDDGNLVVSIRHQHWVIKIAYNNGTGDGSILWRLGEGGDFTLMNGDDPVDWFYAQHGPSFWSASTSGVFSLALMDNGDNRQLSSDPADICGSGTDCYSTVPIVSIDESARTATLIFHDVFAPAEYSSWGGGTTPLANGNLEFDLCDEPDTTSDVYEVTSTSTPQTIWHMHVSGENLYRANRIPSLYPGVQW